MSGTTRVVIARVGEIEGVRDERPKVKFEVLRRNPWKNGQLGKAMPWTCLLTSWQRWARGGDVLRVGDGASG